MFDITLDQERRLLRVKTRGLWTPSIQSKFIAEVFAKAIPARVRYGSIAILADLREHPIQPAELNGSSKALMSRVTRLNNGPIAFVVGSVLGKIQADRVLSVPTSKIFLDINDAEDWLKTCWIDQGYVFADRIRNVPR